MVAIEGVPPEKVVYVPNAYIPAPQAETHGDVRAELGVPPGQLLVGAVSVFRTVKRIDVLIDAFALLAARRSDVRLVIGGYGPLAEELHAQSKRLGVDDRIHWLGLRSDPEAVQRALDVSVISSDSEGMPLAAFECMAVGTPLVATDVGALRDVFEDGVSALLVPRRDPGALAGALEALLADPGRRRAMAVAASARLDEYSLDRTAQRVADLYEELLVRPGLAREPREATAGAAR
jgi:glycosyltransferase involved in cell wall biosynthesis